MAMPTSIVLPDAEATPVNHTFIPVAGGASTRLVNETGAATIAGQETLEVEVTRPKTDAAQHTARVVLWDPVEGTVDGKVQILYGGSAAANFKFPPSMTYQQKLNIIKMMEKALGDLDIKNAIAKGVPLAV